MTSFISGLLFGLAALTRPEGYLFMALGIGLVLILKFFRPTRSDFVWFSAFLLCTLPHVVWKYWYYGGLLPNTFYAKVSGVWLQQGFSYLYGFLRHYSLWLLIPLTVGNLKFLDYEKNKIQWRDNRFIISAYFGIITIIYTAYLLAVGGDRFEYRLLDPILPLIYFNIQGGLLGAFEWYNSSSSTKLGKTALKILALSVVLVPLLTAVSLITGFRGSHGVNSVEIIYRYSVQRKWEGKIFQEFILPQETIAVNGAGALPYFNSNNYVLDKLGLNDYEIAHKKLEKRGFIGHEKVASPKYICEQNITFIEIGGQMIRKKTPDSAEINKLSGKGGFGIKLRDNLFLVCATTLTVKQIKDRFKDREIIFLPTNSFCGDNLTGDYGSRSPAGTTLPVGDNV
jgi:hypothetical protein